MKYSRYVVLSATDLIEAFDDLEDADAEATHCARRYDEDQYVYKLHKVYRPYRPESAKDDPEIVYVDP